MNHTIFGRVLYKVYRGRKTGYYIQGLLDTIKWCRPENGKIFIENDESAKDLIIDMLPVFGKYTIEKTNLDVPEEKMITGHEYWKRSVEAKQVPFKERAGGLLKNARKNQKATA